jgi:hypothetical protein
LGFAALMLVFAASRRNSAENTELFQSNAKIFSALEQRMGMDWPEVRRLAALPEYDNLAGCEHLVAEVSDEIGVESPLHSQTGNDEF